MEPGLLVVVAPDPTRGARIADRPCLVHRPERERVLATAEQAVDLDAPAVHTVDDADVTDAAATNPTGARDDRAGSWIGRLGHHGFVHRLGVLRTIRVGEASPT
jgi:hypothetical protein